MLKLSYKTLKRVIGYIFVGIIFLLLGSAIVRDSVLFFYKQHKNIEITAKVADITRSATESKAKGQSNSLLFENTVRVFYTYGGVHYDTTIGTTTSPQIGEYKVMIDPQNPGGANVTPNIGDTLKRIVLLALGTALIAFPLLLIGVPYISSMRFKAKVRKQKNSL